MNARFYLSTPEAAGVDPVEMVEVTLDKDNTSVHPVEKLDIARFPVEYAAFKNPPPAPDPVEAAQAEVDAAQAKLEAAKKAAAEKPVQP